MRVKPSTTLKPRSSRLTISRRQLFVPRSSAAYSGELRLFAWGLFALFVRLGDLCCLPEEPVPEPFVACAVSDKGTLGPTTGALALGALALCAVTLCALAFGAVTLCALALGCSFCFFGVETAADALADRI